MAFEGVAALALLAMVAVAAVVWVSHPPSWGVLVLGGAGWLVAVGVTVACTGRSSGGVSPEKNHVPRGL